MKSKYSFDVVAAFEKLSRKNTKPDRVWVYQVTVFRGEFKNFFICKANEIYLQNMKQELR